MDYYMAPLEGITGYIYRNAVHDFFGSGITKYFTPFIEPHVQRKNLKHREQQDILPAHNCGIRLVPQILTNSAEAFLLLEEELRQYGYTELNLNLGCPSPTVVTKGRGAGLLREPERLDAMLSEIYAHTHCAVSVKTRIGYAETAEWRELLAIFNQYPLSELIIHPRVREELYQFTPHLDAFVYALRHSPHRLCYNGDIRDAAGYRGLMELFAAQADGRLPDAVMAGRGMLVNPKLLTQLAYADRIGGMPQASVETDTQLSATTSPLTAEIGSIGNDASPLPHGTVTDIHPRTSAETEQDILAPPTADELRAFTGRLLHDYGGVLSGETPVLHKMKELWSWLILNIPDNRRLLKGIVKAKHFPEYEAAVAAALAAYAEVP